MAEVSQREWKIPGQRTKRKAWGYTVTVKRADGTPKRTKSYRAEWTKDQAEEALAKVLLQIEAPKAHAAGITLAQAAERYLASKARKRSIGEDKRQLEHLKGAFGAETPLSAITASKVSEYKAQRLGTKSERTDRALTAAAVNRPLALLRHLLRLAHEEWEILAAVPKIRLEKEPQGRIRWLEPEEEARLLAACAKSQNKYLLAIVTVALESGMRKGELLGLTWDRVDFSRGVLRLEVTKSGRRREVPMRQAVYTALTGLPRAREGRVWPAGSIRTAFENAVADAKLDAPFHFHDTRHHFASWYVMRGGALPALQQILGHATLAMTMKYAHLSPKHLRDEMARTERSVPAVELISNRAQDRAQETLTEEKAFANIS
jgi:integrase